MTRRHVTPILVAFALLPASASAATLGGTVVGEPSAGTVPVLLGEGSRTAARLAKPLTRVQAVQIRTRNGRLAPSALRIGDRVAFAARGKPGARRTRTSVLRVRARGSAPTFAALAASRTATQTSAAKALASADDLLAGRVPQDAPGGNAKLRADLIALRTQVNLLIADLRTTGAGFGTTLDQIAAARPADASRAASVAGLQAPFLTAITASRDSALTAADDLDTAVASLDERINDVGGASAPSVPFGTTSTASDLIQGVLDVLRQVKLPLIPPTG